MRLVVRKGLATAMAASGMLAAAAGCAFADSGAQGSAVGSPGLLSGNLVQLPVNVPVNVCGDTVNVVGLLNPATGNSCANVSHGGAAVGGSTTHGTGSTAHGGTAGSPGVGSGLSVQLPVHVPVNVSGDSVGVVSVGDPAVGNTSTNGSAPAPATHRVAPRTPAEPHRSVPRQQFAHILPARVSLAHTGTDGIGYVAAASALSLLCGVVLYRRFRPGKTS